MDRKEIFRNLMDEIYMTTKLVHEYESIPRNYGTDDLFYMVEMHTLEIIGNHDKITAKEIVDMTDRTKGAVSQMLDKLMKKDLIKKHRNPENLREHFIELTEKGEIVHAYHQALDDREYGKHLENLNEISNADFQTFIKISKIFNAGMKRATKGKDIRLALEEIKK